MMNDSDIRLSVKRTQLKRFYNDGESRIIDELGILWGRSRIDLAVINGHLWGYEIKSEADTLDRLKGQAQDYNSVFDYLTIIAHEKHMNGVLDFGNEFSNWGIIIASQDYNGQVLLRRHRASKYNRETTSLSLLFLIWKEEAQKLLLRHGIAFGKNSNRNELYELISSKLPKRIIQTEVREILKNRANWRVG